MRTSDAGVGLIKSFEGLRLKAYQDSANVWTIGYGSTKYTSGLCVKKGDSLPGEHDALLLFRETLTFYESIVNKAVTVSINQNQFDALVSLCYNIGDQAFSKSSLVKALNAENYKTAANQFLVWDKITDPVTHTKLINHTLHDRRQKERQLFLNNILK